MCPRLLGGGLIPEMIRSPLPSWGFDPALAVFAEAMAVRAGVLFAAAPIVQGNMDGSGTPDVLSFGRGSQVHDNFYENFDPYQGSFAVIWDPEKDRDVTETDDEYLFYASATYWLRYEHDGAVLRAQIGTQEVTRAHTSVAGTTYCIVVLWDTQNKIDGTNYAVISVDDTETWGITVQPTVAVPGATEYVGSNAGTTLPANALLEALACSRIPLFNGTYGVDINGSGVDIVAALYAGGAYEDLAKLIPAWHFPFFLPTDSTPGALGTTGQAWGWDYGANVLGAGDGYCATTYAGSNWVTEGTPSDGPKDIASTVDQVFGLQGYQFTTTSTATGATGDGVSISLTGQAAGASYLLVVDAHEEGVTETGVELLTNTGFTTGGTGGDFNGGAEIDDGVSDDFTDWVEEGIDDPSGDKVEATATVHGGSVAVKLTRTIAASTIDQYIAVTPGAHYAFPFWTKGDGAVAGRYFVYDATNGANIIGITSTGVIGAYAQVTAYFTAPRACTSILIRFLAPSAAGVCYFDDVSLYRVADDIRISILDDTAATGTMHNTADFDFGAGSGYVQMAEGVLTFQLPETPDVAVDCTAFTLKILGTAAGQTVYLHQVLLYENLVDNPSMEGTWAGGPPTIPPGWTNLDLDAGDIEESSGDGGIIHSGAEALQFNVGALNEGLFAPIVSVSGTFYALGMFSYADGTVGLRTGPEFPARGTYHNSTSEFELDSPHTALWSHVYGVARADSGWLDPIIRADPAAAGARYADDYYTILLRAVTLTVTPRTKANSTEGDWLTIDGRDSAAQPISADAIQATKGHIKIKVKPRHDIADMDNFGETTPYFFVGWGDATNYFLVQISAANTVTLTFNDGGGVHTANWAAAGALVADGEYLFEAKWNPGWMKLIVDAVTQITITQPVDFAVVPTHIYPGSTSTLTAQIDAAFAKP